MNLLSTMSVGVVAMVGALAGCAQADVSSDVDATESVEQKKVIGPTNDLVPVVEDGANVPAKYAPLLDAFGLITVGCTATHIGDGLVVSAGHCFNATSVRRNNLPCPGISVHWGTRADKEAYLTSSCTVVLAAEQNDERDYAIFRIDNVPPVHVDIDLDARAAVDTEVTIFSHPQRRPLEWSKTCALKAAAEGHWGVDMFSHQCDTERGSSGASILDDASLKVVGIHGGGNTNWNYGTHLTDTPIAEYIDAAL